MANLFARGVQAAWLASLRRPTNRFIAAVKDPEATQRRKLQGILARHTDTAYGREHHFMRVGTAAQWQSQVPLSDATSIAPYVARIAQGESQVLTRDPVLTLEPSAGTESGTPRLIPYTQGLIDELMAATGPWLFEIYRQWPEIMGTRTYWSASTQRHASRKSSGGIPIATQDDSAYFGPLEGWANAKMTAGTQGEPSDTTPRDPLDAACELLEADDLGFFSVWDPQHLLDLVALISGAFEEALERLSAARATNVRGAVTRAGAVTLKALWPSLTLVSCWGDGPSSDARKALQALMPGVALQAKGLLATEGVVTVPVGARDGALAAVSSHFLEFINLDAPHQRPHLVHEVREDATYSPVMTTSGGLFRYQLGDVVRCVGHTAATPHFVYEGRLPAPQSP